MLHSLHHTNAVRGITEVQGFIIGTKEKITAHTGGEINNDIDITTANTLHDFSVKLHPSTGFTAIRFSNMDVGNCSPSFSCLNRSCCYFLRGDWNRRMLANRVARTGYRTADNNIAVHLTTLVCLSFVNIFVWVI